VVRIALFSDIHGNSIALDAVLRDIQAQGGADVYWVLGDLVAIGPDPIGVLERLSGLPEASFVQGNTDRYILRSEQPGPTLEQARSDPSLLPIFTRIAQSFAWTQGAIVASGWLPWLEALLPERRIVLPDGSRLLGVHVLPGHDDGWGAHPALSEAELKSLLGGCEAEVVCVGHTHWPLDLRVGGTRLVNLGSVSNPFPPDLRASYVILEADGSGYRVHHRRVDYDREAVIAQARRTRHPAAHYIIQFMRGQNRPLWSKDGH